MVQEYTRQQVPVLPLSPTARCSSSESTRIAEHLQSRTAIDHGTALDMARKVYRETRRRVGAGDGIPTRAETDQGGPEAGGEEADEELEELEELETKAWVYLWSDPLSKLEPDEWE